MSSVDFCHPSTQMLCNMSSTVFVLYPIKWFTIIPLPHGVFFTCQYLFFFQYLRPAYPIYNEKKLPKWEFILPKYLSSKFMTSPKVDEKLIHHPNSAVHSDPMTDVIQLEVNCQIKLCLPSVLFRGMISTGVVFFGNRVNGWHLRKAILLTWLWTEMVYGLIAGNCEIISGRGCNL